MPTGCLPLVSYLEDPRVLFAAERTLLAWQRTTIALMGLGFVVERFGLFLRVLTDQPYASANRHLSLWLGVALLLIAAASAIFSALQFRRIIQNLGASEIPSYYRTSFGIWTNVALAVISLILAANFFWSTPV